LICISGRRLAVPAADHPELHGHIIGQADAISLADCAFRGLLAS